MLPTIENKIKFTRWTAIIVILIFAVPMYYAVFEPDTVDDGNLKFSKFIICFFCTWVEIIVLLCFDIRFSIKLDKCKDNINKANKIREYARKFNNISGVIAVATLVSCFVVPTMNTTFICFFGGFLLIYFMIGFACLGGFYKKHSQMSVEDLQGTDYILYLRAFSEDRKSFVQRAKPVYFGRLSDFIEEEFLKFFPSSVAVGQPGELLQSRGARRLYFSESEWKRSVQLMIEECKFLFILISSNPNCIWEIKNVKENLNKVVFIVNDMSEYFRVRKTMSEEIDFPLWENLNAPFCFYIDKESTRWTFIKFKNSIEAYHSVADHITTVMCQ